jgi:hypothetical protein
MGRAVSRRTLAVVLVGAALASGACGEDSKPQQPSQPPARKSNSPAAVSSGIEGVPIPSGSKRYPPEIPDAWGVEALTYMKLVDWYHEHMPVGKNFRDWDWCRTAGGVDRNFYSLIYSQGVRKILSVALTGVDPPAVQIRQDRSGPCRRVRG